MSRPEPGDKVWVIHEDDSHQQAIFIAGSVMPTLCRVSEDGNPPLPLV